MRWRRRKRQKSSNDTVEEDRSINGGIIAFESEWIT
jgi:hypothetical protein